MQFRLRNDLDEAFVSYLISERYLGIAIQGDGGRISNRVKMTADARFQMQEVNPPY